MSDYFHASTSQMFTSSTPTELVPVSSRSPWCDRIRLDHEYHGYYTTERQEQVHLPLLQKLLHVEDTPDANGESKSSAVTRSLAVVMSPLLTGHQPLLILLAGSPGAGKSHMLRKLLNDGKHGHAAMHRFVWNDPDQFKSALPEAERFASDNPDTAGSRLHRESTYLSERLLWETLWQGRSTSLEGSLRDAVWHIDLVARVRKQFPYYRIVVLHVTAPRQMIVARAHRRCLATKRCIPLALIDECLQQVPAAVEAMRPVVDSVVTVDNNYNDNEEDSASNLPTSAWAKMHEELFCSSRFVV